MFFVATALKACYGKLPDWAEDEGGFEEGFGRDAPRGSEAAPGRAELPPHAKRARKDAEDESPIDAEYRRLYRELRDCALSDTKALVREHVERLGTSVSSYEFMNVYGLCSLEKLESHGGASRGGRVDELRCKFTELGCPSLTGAGTGEGGLATVCGVLSPLLAARVQPAALTWTRCSEADYSRTQESYVSLVGRRASRAASGRLSHNALGVGSTVGSMERSFLFCVREDLHSLGCAYRQLVASVELLHLNITHFLHA